MLKFTRWFYISVLILAGMSILLVGCGKDGALNPLDPPKMIITSYEGVDDFADVADPYFYQKRIFWRGESRGGVIDGYAYRVLNLDGNPIQTPRTYIDEEGWIYHYRPGADQSRPLTDPDVRTIWTKKVHDVVHFPASVDGDSTLVTSLFEIKCKDHREQESNIARRFFNVVSHVPDVDVIFSDRYRPLAAAEVDDYATTGLGFEVEFEIEEHTPYVQPPNPANYFKFRIEKWDTRTDELISKLPTGENEWFDTREQRNVRRIWLAMQDDDKEDFGGRDDVFFALSPDEFVGDDFKNEANTETRLVFKAVNMADVHSVERTAKFSVYDQFRPKVMIYRSITYVLGRNHFTYYKDDQVTRPIPEADTPDGTHYGLPFFVNSEGKYSALKSDDIKIYLRWGWKGQYDEDDPNKGLINQVHDYRQTSPGEEIDYLGTIRAFDLRMNGAPFFYPPLANDPEYTTRYLHRDDEGREWLRVPRHHEIDTRVLLTSVPAGEHHFEVRVLDSQNRTSAIEDFNFVIQRPIPRAQKDGILIIDNDTYPASGPTALDAATNTFYSTIVEQYGGMVDRIDRLTLRNTVWQKHSDKVENVISSTDLEPYRLVIWHSDMPTQDGDFQGSNFHLDLEAINLYMRGADASGGGNLLLSAGQNLKYMHEFYMSGAFALPLRRHPNISFERYFGLPYFTPDAIRRVSTAFTSNTYFVGASPVSGTNYPEIELNASFHPVVNIRGALGPVAYFEEELLLPNAQVIYRMNVSEAPGGAGFADKAVAIRTSTNRNTSYLFGFPLSYMNVDDVKTLMDRIIGELW